MPPIVILASGRYTDNRAGPARGSDAVTAASRGVAAARPGVRSGPVAGGEDAPLPSSRSDRPGGGLAGTGRLTAVRVVCHRPSATVQVL